MVTPVVARLALVAVLVLASGCAKAAYLPNDHGGYTLMTKVGSMQDAVVRFRRTAGDLCKSDRYALTPPEIVTNGWGLFGSEIDVRSELTCR